MKVVNQTGQLLTIFYWDDAIEEDSPQAVLKPGDTIDMSFPMDSQWSAASGNVRLDVYTATDASDPTWVIQDRRVSVKFINQRTEPVEVLQSTNQSERYEPLAQIAPGATANVQALVGSVAVIAVNGEIAGSALILAADGQDVRIVPDKEAAMQNTPVKVSFVNQTARDLHIFLQNPETGALDDFAALPARSTFDSGAAPMTQWVVAAGDDQVGTFQVTPAPSVEFVIHPEDLP